MSDFPVQDVTIYHKNKENKYERYVKEASFRNTSILQHSKDGFSGSDSVIARIFDVETYNNSLHNQYQGAVLNLPLNSFLGKTWKVAKGDVLVNGTVFDEIKSAPITELSKKYGQENVFKINSISIFVYEDEDLKELNHIKLGCI